MSVFINSYRYAGYDSQKSALLDGVNENINVGSDSSLKQNRSQAQSYSAWIKVNSTSQEYIFGGRQGGDTINTLAWFVFNGNLSFWMRGNGGSSDQFRVNSTTSLSTSTWYHVVSTYDGSSNASGVTHYINGSSDTDTDEFDNLANDIDFTGFTFYLGDLNGSISFDGYLDEVSIWDKELTASEVTELYNSGCPTNLNNHSAKSNIVSWWAIDSSDDMTASTGSVADKIGSNTGTPTNTESGDLDSDTIC